MLQQTHPRFPRFRPPYSIPVVTKGWVFLTSSSVSKSVGAQGHSMPTLSLLETTRQEQYLLLSFSKVKSQQELRDPVFSHVAPQMSYYS